MSAQQTSSALRSRWRTEGKEPVGFSISGYNGHWRLCVKNGIEWGAWKEWGAKLGEDKLAMRANGKTSYPLGCIPSYRKDQNHPLSLSCTTESLTLTPNWEGVLLQHGFFSALVSSFLFWLWQEELCSREDQIKDSRPGVKQSKTNAKTRQTGKPEGENWIFLPVF